MTKSQFCPFVMNVFAPLMTQSSPSRTARVATFWRSEPTPGSVIAIAPISSPAARPGRYFCWRCSLPKPVR